MNDKDLKEIVKKRLQQSVDGKEVDTLRQDVRIPHLLGIAPLEGAHDRSNEEDTLLDPNHSFWSEYDETVSSRREALSHIDRVLRLLRKDGTLEIMYPYGEEADIVYIEVDGSTETKCVECGSIETATSTWHEAAGDQYVYILEVQCQECGFTGEYETPLTRR